MRGDSHLGNDGAPSSKAPSNTLSKAPLAFGARPLAPDAHPTVPHMRAAQAFAPPREVMDTPRELVVPAAPDGARATLTAMTGLDAGRVFSVDTDEIVIGRATTSHVWIDDASVSRRHARIVRRAGGPYYLEDLGSTNGTFLGERRVDRCKLATGDRVQVGPTFLLRFAIVDNREDALQKELFHAATRDGLTGLFNRRYFDERLLAEVSRARRARVPLSLFMLDLDRFKQLNDARGHLAGDQVLRAVSAQLLRMVRLEDVLARYGGEEIVLLAPGSDLAEATHLGERLRASVEHLSVQIDQVPGTRVKLTVSVGVASLSEIELVEPAPCARELVARADARLYRAKEAGRNRVSAAG